MRSIVWHWYPLLHSNRASESTVVKHKRVFILIDIPICLTQMHRFWHYFKGFWRSFHILSALSSFSFRMWKRFPLFSMNFRRLWIEFHRSNNPVGLVTRLSGLGTRRWIPFPEKCSSTSCLATASISIEKNLRNISTEALEMQLALIMALGMSWPSLPSCAASSNWSCSMKKTSRASVSCSSTSELCCVMLWIDRVERSSLEKRNSHQLFSSITPFWGKLEGWKRGETSVTSGSSTSLFSLCQPNRAKSYLRNSTAR